MSSSDEDEVDDANETISLSRLLKELQNTQENIQFTRTDNQNIQQQLKYLTKKMTNLSSVVLSVILYFLFLKEIC
jgi:predicted PurR-regulated permease PerM